MKELQIEEKAFNSNYKAYTELINRLEAVKDAIKKLNYGIAMDVMCKPYPEFQVTTHSELKENDDERIRKELIEFFTFEHWDGEAPFSAESARERIAWLEKQGEKKAAEEIEPTPIFRIGDVIKRKGKDYTFRVDRIQGGYYHCDRNYGAYFPIEDQDNWELVEQNPEWTPMDEQRVENLLAIIEGHGYPGEVAWLNSLKDRVQPKQEWSEEDKNMLQSVLDEYKSMPTEKRNWLKSLKERYTWKPSDAQMKALYDVLNPCDGIDKEVLGSLYNDIKKLREE